MGTPAGVRQKVSRQDDSVDYLTTTLSLLAEKEGSYLHVAPWRTDCIEPQLRRELSRTCVRTEEMFRIKAGICECLLIGVMITKVRSFLRLHVHSALQFYFSSLRLHSPLTVSTER